MDRGLSTLLRWSTIAAAAIAFLATLGGAAGAVSGTVSGRITGAPPAKGMRLAFVDVVPLETEKPSSTRLAGRLAYALSVPARPAILAGTVIDFGSQRVYSGSTEPFVAGGAVHKDVAVRPTPGSRSLASAARTSRADGSRVAFEVGSASLTFPDGHVNARRHEFDILSFEF